MPKSTTLEKRARRYNFRGWGLPETITDVPNAVSSLIKELIQDILPHKLELDWAHRALGLLCKDGLPCKIVVKPHFYAVKKEVMKRTCSIPQLKVMGQPIQIFADISPSTIQRRPALKPLLTALTQKNTKYWWLFPFRIKFEINNRQFRFSTFSEREPSTELGLHLQRSSFPDAVFFQNQKS